MKSAKVPTTPLPFHHINVLEVAGRAGAGVQQYAVDTQAYRHCKASEAMHALTELVNTIAEIKDWMSSNRLKLNPTQYIWIGNKIQLAKIDRQELLQRFPGIVFETSVIDLGVDIDEELKMDAHVGRITRSCFYQLRQIRTIRQSLSDSAIRTLIHSFVVTRIDYCNSCPVWHHRSTDRTSSENFECSSSSRTSNSKVCSSINADQRQSALAPRSATNQVQDLAAGCKLSTSESTSVSSGTLRAGFGGTGASTLAIRRPILSGVNRCRLSSMQRRGFAVAGPLAWNDLPVAVRVSIARSRIS